MTQSDIRSALFKAITLMPQLDTAWPNRKFTPKVNLPYQAINIMYGEPENTSYGECHREVGFLHVVLRYPAGVGTKGINQRAELIRDTFFRGHTLVKNDSKVIIQRTPEIMSGYNEEERYVVEVKIRFFVNPS